MSRGMIKERNMQGLIVHEQLAADRRYSHPLLLIHGMFGGAWYWQDYLNFFSERGWDCYAVNLRGHFLSRPGTELGRVSLLDYVEDVRTVLGEIGPAVLIGHSMGGLIAQKVTEQTHGQIPALILIASAVPSDVVTLNAEVSFRSLKYLAAMWQQYPFLPLKADADYFFHGALSPELQQQAYARLVPESGRAAWELAFGFLTNALSVDPSRITCPTLIVAAGQDRTMPRQTALALARKYRAPIKEYPELGHVLILETGWEQPAGEIADWLAQTLGSSDRRSETGRAASLRAPE